MANARRPYAEAEGGVLVFARATPGAAKNDIAGPWAGSDGETRLSIRVTAAPDKGKANAAILKLLAKRLGVPKSSLSIASGETSRLKTIVIDGEQAVITAALEMLTGDS